MQYYNFSDEAVQNVLEAAKRSHQDSQERMNVTESATSSAHSFSALAQCISVTIENGKVCFNLPLGFGSHCISLPVTIPDGTVAQACLSICSIFGIPRGIRVSIEVAGKTILSQTYGIC